MADRRQPYWWENATGGTTSGTGAKLTIGHGFGHGDVD